MNATTQKTKPKVGKLILLIPGQPSKVLDSNKPFAILQNLKKTYIQFGHKKENLKITY